MNEYERKFRCDNTKQVRKTLAENGFVTASSKHQQDTYFLVGAEDTQGNRTYLRVREDKQKSVFSLDFHVVLDNDTTKETEVEVSDADNTISILQEIGHEIVCVVDKKRDTYDRDDVTVTIDSIGGLGEFVEVEVVSNDKDAAIQKIEEVCTLLGVTDQVSGRGYPELVMEHENT